MNNVITTDPGELRKEFVARLTTSAHLRTREIIDAFRTVERHAFVPDADPATAYGEGTIPIKDTPDDGETLSCISAPTVVATQLEQLAPQPGHRVLEAGAATGYNAALLGRLVGPGGHVWTVDVDEDLVSGAAANLASAGIFHVRPLASRSKAIRVKGLGNPVSIRELRGGRRLRSCGLGGSCPVHPWWSASVCRSVTSTSVSSAAECFTVPAV